MFQNLDKVKELAAIVESPVVQALLKVPGSPAGKKALADLKTAGAELLKEFETLEADFHALEAQK